MPFDSQKEALKHVKRLDKYAEQVKQAYDKANKELARIALSVDHPIEELFRIKDHPEIKARVNGVINTLKRDIQAVILNGEAIEWGYANKLNDGLVVATLGLTAASATPAQRKRFFNQNQPALSSFQRGKRNGLTLSERVWNLTKQYKSDIEMGLSVGIADGRSAAELSRDLRKFLNEPDRLFRRVRDEFGNLNLSKAALSYNPGQGVYRSSYKNAMRLARTEINTAYHAAEWERWQQLDFVVGYEVRRSSNPYPCPVCEALAGKYRKDFVWLLWHPQCMCQAFPILKTEEEMERDDERMMRGMKPSKQSVNTVKDLPEGFKKWVEDNRDRIDKANARGTLPQWIKDNHKAVGIRVNPINSPQQAAIRREAKIKFNSYGPEWKKEYFDPYSGGYNVYHKNHNFSETGGGGEAEKAVGFNLAKYNGKRVEFLAEGGTKSADLRFDGQTWDVKYVEMSNSVKSIRNRINDAKKADNVIFHFQGEGKKELIRDAANREIGRHAGRLNELPNIYYVDGSGLLKVLWEK